MMNSKSGDTKESLLTGRFYFERETLVFVLLSAADVFMTYFLLQQDVENLRFVESNPLARFFLDHWGSKGMIYLKFGMIGVICVLTQIIARWRPRTARLLLIFAIVSVTYVLVYSVRLYRTHARPGAPPPVESFWSPVPHSPQFAKLG
jgi:hypothetical protein